MSRKPNEEDRHAWIVTVSRGVGVEFTGWELLSAYTCGDESRMRAALTDMGSVGEEGQ